MVKVQIAPKIGHLCKLYITLQDSLFAGCLRLVVVFFEKKITLARRPCCKYLLIVLFKGLFQDPSFLKMLEAADESVALLEIVSALADQTFEFPMASTFEQLKDNYGEGMVQSVKRVVNILALPFSAQASIKVMSAQADELTRRFKFTTSVSERTSVSHNSMPKLSENKVDSDDEEKDRKDGSDDEEEEVKWSSFL